MQFINNIFDFFIPRFCICCDSKLETSESFVCNSCMLKFNKVPDELLADEYSRKFKNSDLISGLYSHLVFIKDSEIQTIIHSLKYQQKFLIGKMLGKLAANGALDKINSWKCNAIIPIPLHKLKKTKRGYNQAYFISKGIADIIELPVVSNAIKRIKFTETQTKLNIKERENNVYNAFKIRNKNRIKNKNLILVDDVITTGATIKECAKILKENGAKNIFAISVALANHGKITSNSEPKLIQS